MKNCLQEKSQRNRLSYIFSFISQNCDYSPSGMFFVFLAVSSSFHLSTTIRTFLENNSRRHNWLTIVNDVD